MNKTEITTIATAYMNIWNTGQEHLLDEYADKHIIADYSHFEKPYQGIAAYKAALKTTYSFFPDIHITLNEVIPTANGAVVSWQYTGTHTSGNLFGVEASGKKVTVKGISILVLKDNLVVKESGIVDNFSLLLQLGAFK